MTSVVRLLTYQVFDSVRAVVPLRGGELVFASQDHTQHQHLFPVPEGRGSSQKSVHDHPRTPPGITAKTVLTGICF